MIQFKQSPVIFDEDSHSYHLGEKRLLGITGLIHSILGLGVYPEADNYVKDFIIPKAGSRGTAVHHAIQTYDQLGIRQTEQTVKTRYGCKERDNIEYVDETWDVSMELDAYINHRLHGFKPLANELTVSDNDRWASQIDNVWLEESTGRIWLVDTKTNNINLYPTVGYYQSNYFATGEDALKEYLSWQLSIYAVLFEKENPDYKVEGLACNWLRGGDSAFWIIERKPDDLVLELLKTEYIFGDNGPIYFHPNQSLFTGSALPTKPEEAKPIVPFDVVQYTSDLMKLAEETNKKLDEAKKALRLAMEQHGLKTWDSGLFKATIAVDSERTKFDTAKFKKDFPDLYQKYITKTTVKGGFTLK